jgi:Glycosyl hydrolase family 76
MSHSRELVAACACALACVAVSPASAARRSAYPAGATRATFSPTRSELARAERARGRGRGRRAHGASSSGGSSAPGSSAPGSTGGNAPSAGGGRRRGKGSVKARKTVLHGDPARALVAFEAMQQHYYIAGSGLYLGEPFSYLWPFSQALAATVSVTNIPHVGTSLAKEVDARLTGLNTYLDTDNGGASEGVYTSTLAAFDGTVAPPAGPGGPKYYDDNDWVGIELARLYELTHKPALLGSAEGIMAFEMAGWQGGSELACAGGIPFENTPGNRQRNTVTTAPAAELALQLYRITREAQYLQFAQLAYEWVRACLLEGNGMYADHISRRGAVERALWSYNQGSMIGAGTLLYQLTGDSAYLYEARQTATAALAYFTQQRLESENPFFVSVYFRDLLYLDSVTGDPPGRSIAQNYVNYAWQHRRLSDDVFVMGSPPSAQLLVQAAMVQIYALLSTPASTYF